MLRAEQRAPVELPACQPRTFPNAGTNSTSLTRGTVPAAVDTVFVVNKAQWERVHGAAAVATALAGLDGQMAALAADGHPSAILQVDADPDVQSDRRELECVPDPDHTRRMPSCARSGSRSTRSEPRTWMRDRTRPSRTSSCSAGTRSSPRRGSRTARPSRTRTATRRRSTGRASSRQLCGSATSSPTIRTATSTRSRSSTGNSTSPTCPSDGCRRRPPHAVRAVARFTAFDGRLAPATAVDDRLRLPHRRRPAGRRGAALDPRRRRCEPAGADRQTAGRRPSSRARSCPAACPRHLLDQRPRRPLAASSPRPGRRCSASATCRR